MTINLSTSCIDTVGNAISGRSSEFDVFKPSTILGIEEDKLRTYLVGLFGALEQKIVDKAPLDVYEDIADELLEDEIINVNQKELVLLVALCLTDVMALKRESAYEFINKKKNGVYIFFLKCLSYLNEDPVPEKVVCLLERLSAHKTFTHFIEEPDLYRLFLLFFDVLGPNHSSEVVICILDIMVALIAQCKNKFSCVPDGIIRVLFANLQPGCNADDSMIEDTQDLVNTASNDAPSASAQLLAQQIFYKSSDLLAPNVNTYLSSVLGDLDMSIGSEWSNFHDLIYKLFCISPSLVDTSLPLLEKFLVKTDVQLRKKTVNVLGCIFATPGVDSDMRYYHLFNLFTKRFKDQEASIRIIMTEFAEAYVINSQSSSNIETVLEGLKDRLQDLDEAVRLSAVKVVISLAQSSSITKITPGIWQECFSRMRDRKEIIRKEMISGLAQIYSTNHDSYSLDHETFSMILKIPQNILSIYPVEFTLVEQILFGTLIGTGDDSLNVAKKWINLVTNLDEIGKKSLFKLFQDKLSVRSELRNWVKARKEKNQDSVEKSLATISSNISPSAPAAHLERLKQLNAIENDAFFEYLNALTLPSNKANAMSNASKHIASAFKSFKAQTRRNLGQLADLLAQRAGLLKLSPSFMKHLPDILFALSSNTKGDSDSDSLSLDTDSSSMEKRNSGTGKKNSKTLVKSSVTRSSESKSRANGVSAPGGKVQESSSLENSKFDNASSNTEKSDLLSNLVGSIDAQISSVLFLIEILVPCFAHHFANSLPVIMKLLHSTSFKIVDVVVEAFVHFVPCLPKKVDLKGIKTQLDRLILNGTPKQAKYAAKALSELHRTHDVSLKSIIGLLVRNATEVGSNSAATFSSLIEFSCLLSDVQMEHLFEYVLNELLTRPWPVVGPGRRKKGRDLEECDKTPLVQTQAEAIYFLTKCLVNQMKIKRQQTESTPSTSNSETGVVTGPVFSSAKLMHFIESFFKFEFEILQKSNPKDEQLHYLQSIVISSILRLAEFKKFDSQISIANLQIIANFASTGPEVVRTTLKNCLFNGLKSLKKLPLKYLALCPFVTGNNRQEIKHQFEEVVELRRRFMKERAKNYFKTVEFNAIIRCVLPEYSLPWFVYLLSHRPNFPEFDEPQFTDTIGYISTFFSVIMQKNDHYDFVMQFLTDMKQTQDAQDPDSHNIHIVIDLCSMLLKQKMDCLKPSLDSLIDSRPIEVILPKELFQVPIVDGKPSLLPLDRTYLPNEFKISNTSTKKRSTPTSKKKKRAPVTNDDTSSSSDTDVVQGKLVNSKLKK